MSHLGPRMLHPHNSASAVGIFLQFYTMKKAKRDMEIILMVFQKKNLIKSNLVIWVSKWYVLITLDLLSGFLLILYNKKGQDVHESHIIFWEKMSFWVIFYCLIGCGQNWARPLLLLDL